MRKAISPRFAMSTLETMLEHHHPAVDLEAFRVLRSHLGAAYNNDGAALAATFLPYSTFGADYSAPSTRYISDRSKNHGHSGSFVLTILEASIEGRAALESIRRLLELPPPPLAAFATACLGWNPYFFLLSGTFMTDVPALALGLHNDFAIRQRVAHSFGEALPSGLQVDRCRRVTSLTMQSKNFFDCTLRSAKHAGVPYRLEIHGRCWHALRLRNDTISSPL